MSDILPASGLWFVVPDYDLGSRELVCSISGTSKRVTDIGVFRPATDMAFVEGEGTYDISQLAIEEAAKLLNWSSPGEVEARLASIRKRCKELATANLRLGKERSILETKLEAAEAELRLLRGEE